MTHLEEVDEPAESDSFIRPKKASKWNKTKVTNDTKIIKNDLKNSTKAGKGIFLKNNTKQVSVAKNNLDPVKNSTESDKEVSLRDNIKEVSVPLNHSEVGINKTEIIDDLKNTTKSEKEVSIAQNHFEVDQTNNEIIHHHHNPSNASSIARIKRDANKPKTPKRYLPTSRGLSGANGTDDEFDSRYLLVHEIPPFRKKRSYDDNDHMESCDHQKAKNITIIIQNFLSDLEDPSTTSLNPKSNIVSSLHRTKRSSYFQQDDIGNQPGDSKNAIELKDEEDEDADKNLQNDATESADTETNNFEEKWKMRYRYYDNVYQTKVKVLKRE